MKLLAALFIFLALLFFLGPTPAAAGCSQSTTYTQACSWPTCNASAGNGCTVSGNTAKKTLNCQCLNDLSCPSTQALDCDVINYTCTDQASANAVCGISPPPPPPPTGSCSPNCGTPPNCYSCSTPPTDCTASGLCGTYPYCYTCSTSYGYGCSGSSCTWIPGGTYPNNQCGNFSCLRQECSLSYQITPTPVEAGQPISFKFIEGPGTNNANRGYVDVSSPLDTGGGAGSCNSAPVVDGGCNNNNGQSCSWTYNCNAVSTTSEEYQHFQAYFHAYLAVPTNHAGDCSIYADYIVHGCSVPSTPGNLTPTDGTQLVSITPTFSWTQTSWGTRSPWSALVYLYQGPVSDNIYATCYLDGLDIGAPNSHNISAPMSCFVWSNPPVGAFQGQPVGSLGYEQTYTWTVTANATCGSSQKTATAPYQTFTTVPRSYFKTFGGTVTAKGTLSDSNLNAVDSLGVREYISQKSP